MDKEYKYEEVNIEELVDEFDKLQFKLEQIHDKFIDMTTRFGFASDAARNAKKNFEFISFHLDEHPEYAPIISSAYTQVVLMNQTLHGFDLELLEISEGITSISGSLMTTCSTSGSIISTIDDDYKSSLITPSFLITDSTSTCDKLSRLSLPLANTYKEIEQVFYATNADNTRAALSMMRQTFDHFFAIVAPDDDVRLSEFWEEKTNEDIPDLVTRREKIRYAIATRIKNQKNAEALTNNIDLIVKSYKVLNRLHERDGLKEDSAKQALSSVKYFLEEFASNLR